MWPQYTDKRIIYKVNVKNTKMQYLCATLPLGAVVVAAQYTDAEDLTVGARLMIRCLTGLM